MSRTIEEINEKIKTKKAVVIRADEMTGLVKEQGYKSAFKKVDVVTTGTFGAMCSSGVFFNFKHFDPPTKLQKPFINGVQAYGGVASADIYLGVTQSKDDNRAYGGAQIIEELVKGNEARLISTSDPSDCYPGKDVDFIFKLDDLNQAIMLNPRNGYQRYNGAINTGKKKLNTYLGKLLPAMKNIGFSGSGKLNPIANDPDYETIGYGTKIFIGGTFGRVIGSGTQHNPENGYGTLMLRGNLKEMSNEFLRAAYIEGYGTTLYLGIGLPIPVLNEDIAHKTGIADKDIPVEVVDFSVQSNKRPIIINTNYRELKSGEIVFKGNKIKAGSLSSYPKAVKIAEYIKNLIKGGNFKIDEITESIK